MLAKDLLRYIDEDSNGFNIEEIIRPSVIIPETKRLNVLLSEFKSGLVGRGILVTGARVGPGVLVGLMAGAFVLDKAP